MDALAFFSAASFLFDAQTLVLTNSFLRIVCLATASSWLHTVCKRSGDFCPTISTSTRSVSVASKPCIFSWEMAYTLLSWFKSKHCIATHLALLVLQTVLVILIACAPAIRLLLLQFNVFCECLSACLECLWGHSKASLHGPGHDHGKLI
jgi:hypothetical protein